MNIQSTIALGPSTTAATEEIRKIMQRPLIVGASVSADWAAKSPGKILALRYTDESQIRTLAFGGKSGREVLKQVSAETLSDRSVVIGLDLFFWDATLQSSKESLDALQRLLVLVEALQIPLILGEVPLLMPGLQPGAAAINHALHQIRQTYSRCRIVPFTSMLSQILRDGALSYKGSRYGLRELIPDGLHIGPIASQYIADSLVENLHDISSAR